MVAETADFSWDEPGSTPFCHLPFPQVKTLQIDRVLRGYGPSFDTFLTLIQLTPTRVLHHATDKSDAP
jgi:hypothetical protein